MSNHVKQAYFTALFKKTVEKVGRHLNQGEIYYVTEKTRCRFDRNHPMPDIPDTLKEKFHKKTEKHLKGE